MCVFRVHAQGTREASITSLKGVKSVGSPSSSYYIRRAINFVNSLHIYAHTPYSQVPFSSPLPCQVLYFYLSRSVIKMAPQAAQQQYQKDERVLCFHHELLYEAKIMDSKLSDPSDKKSSVQYLVHYKGWKNT